MILSFGNKETEKIWNGLQVKSIPIPVQEIGRRKLRMINNAIDTSDLRIPPANRLEKLSGNLKNFYSIRINDQWRIIFHWDKGNASDVGNCRLSLNQPIMERLKNIHPGEILSEEFLIPLSITAYKLAKDIGIPQTRISEILKSNRRVTADTALRLGKYFGNSPRFWLGLQDDFDLEEEANAKGPLLMRYKHSGKPLHS